MSRMTKFLKQTCQLSLSKVDKTGQVMLNDFGEPIYERPKMCKCRVEPYFADIQTSNGHIVRATSRYFLDNSYQIRVNDKVDGRAILTCQSYTNSVGAVEGYEVYV